MYCTIIYYDYRTLIRRIHNVTMTNNKSIITDINNHDIKSSATDTESAVVGEVKRRKVTIDETLLQPDAAEKLLARRAYNRECATRARKRCKQMVMHLKKQVNELMEDKEALRRSLETMEKRMVELESRNKAMNLQQMLATNLVGDGMIVDPLAVGSATGSGLSVSAVLQLQLAHQQQQLRLGVPGAGGSVHLAQLSRFMNGQNGYF